MFKSCSFSYLFVSVNSIVFIYCASLPPLFSAQAMATRLLPKGGLLGSTMSSLLGGLTGAPKQPVQLEATFVVTIKSSYLNRDMLQAGGAREKLADALSCAPAAEPLAALLGAKTELAIKLQDAADGLQDLAGRLSEDSEAGSAALPDLGGILGNELKKKKKKKSHGKGGSWTKHFEAYLANSGQRISAKLEKVLDQMKPLLGIEDGKDPEKEAQVSRLGLLSAELPLCVLFCLTPNTDAFYFSHI